MRAAWPLPRVGAVIVVALSLYAAAWRVSPVLRGACDALRSSPGSATARELAPADPWSLAPFIEAARQAVPAGATYAVVVGQDPPTDALRASAIPGLLDYALAPRRYTLNVHQAQWVITYHQSSEKLSVNIGKEIGLGADGNAVEVRR